MKIKLDQLATELIDVTQAATMCGCSPEWIRDLMREGKLTYIEIGENKKKLTLRQFVKPFLTPTIVKNKRRGMR